MEDVLDKPWTTSPLTRGEIHSRLRHAALALWMPTAGGGGTVESRQLAARLCVAYCVAMPHWQSHPVHKTLSRSIALRLHCDLFWARRILRQYVRRYRLTHTENL